MANSSLYKSKLITGHDTLATQSRLYSSSILIKKKKRKKAPFLKLGYKMQNIFIWYIKYNDKSGNKTS